MEEENKIKEIEDEQTIEVSGGSELDPSQRQAIIESIHAYHELLAKTNDPEMKKELKKIIDEKWRMLYR